MVAGPKGLPALFDSLGEYFGDRGWWPGRDQFEICLGAILTQNTAWKNVEAALENLRHAEVETPRKLLALDPARLETLIRSSGYYRQKAKKLYGFCRWILNSWDGDFVAVSRQPAPELRRQLLGLWGIGPETADAILCYTFGKPVFVVDAYLKRILLRHGFISEKADYESMQILVQNALPTDTLYLNQAHGWIVETGKRWCRKENPDCASCPLQWHLTP